MNFSRVTSNRVKSAPITSPSYQLSSGNGTPGKTGDAFYFCTPQNDILLGYWDTVADRLFKVRNCMNLEGVVRELPLFAPPIDPALLVRAVAMGVDLSSALNSINAATPRYRFTYMLPKALELCADIKALGSALLGALEKKDAEELTVLRCSQETNLLKAVKAVKEQQIEEAQDTLDGLNKYREVVRTRLEYYQSIVRISDEEQAHMDGLSTANNYHLISLGLRGGISAAHLLPNTILGSAGFSSPCTIAEWGGNNIANAMEAAASVMEMISTENTFQARMSEIKGGFERRWNEWKQQESVAGKEIAQVEAQIAAAEVRTAIAQLELDNHGRQIDNASAVEEFLRNKKYTNEELYGWMTTQISAVFFQSYQLAYDMARRAERAFQFERGLTTSDYIHFGYWDSRRSGLLAGEQLYLDLKRLELAYLDQNKRDYEIARHISLLLNAPMALISLKETGQCTIDLPEALFDVDYPGHYMRRIKNVTLTIPCVTGPYTSINCTLTLLKSSIRQMSNPAGLEGNYARDVEQDDPRFVDNFSAVESIATSHAQNDSGMFELNFRDERYLPFEGAGVISTWRIEMPQETNAFDFETISDVILNFNYTARDGGKPLQTAGRNALGLLPWTTTATAAAAGESLRLFSLKHEFPTEWYSFLNPKDLTGPSQTLPLALTSERFSFLLRGKQITLEAVTLFLKLTDGFGYDANTHSLIFHLNQNSQVQGGPRSLVTAGSQISGLPFAKADVTPADIPANLVLEVLETDLPNPAAATDKTWWKSVKVNGVNHSRLKPNAIADIWMVCRYSVTSKNH
jgi:hypothetical protein